MIYRLYTTNLSQQDPDAAITVNSEPQISFLFVPTNPDYQNFKANINDDSAQLETNAGVLMSPEAAKAYVATLP